MAIGDIEGLLNTLYTDAMGKPENIEAMARQRPQLAPYLPQEVQSSGLLNSAVPVGDEFSRDLFGELHEQDKAIEGDYAAREADYEQRKAAGDLHGNPFSGLMEGLGKANQAGGQFMQGVMDIGANAGKAVNEAVGPAVQDGINQMRLNMNSHPIYGQPETGPRSPVPGEMNVGGEVVDELYQGVKDDVKVKAEQFKANNAPDEAPVIDTVIQETEKARSEGRSTEAVDSLPEDATTDQVVAAKSADSEKDQIADAKKGGYWSQEWEKATKKFNEQFDLTTVGIALMASNDGSRSLTQNLGYALSQGAAAKKQMAADTAAAAESARKAGIEERETQVKEVKNQIELAKAYTDRLKAANPGIPEWEPSNPTGVALANQALTQNGVDLGQLENAEAATVAISQMINTELKMNPGSNRDQVARTLAAQYIRDNYDDQGKFTWGPNMTLKKGQ